MKKDTVAIIGAGIAGIVTAKECLEANIEVVNFEQKSAMGGVWNKNPEDGKTWNGMIVNQSQHHMSFSDQPHRDGLPDFISGIESMDYLKRCADDFNVTPHIQYNQRIKHIGYKKTQFILDNGKEKMPFDRLVLTTGAFHEPWMKHYKGLNKFQGSIIHSQFYKNAADFCGKEVIVEGRSLSAYEIASDLAMHGVKVHHVFSRPAFIIPRMLDYMGKKIPFDLFFYRYPDPNYKPSKQDAINGRNNFLFQKLGDHGKIHPALHVNPNSGFPEHAVISDHYTNNVKDKMIDPYCDRIACFNSDGATLESGRTIKGNVAVIAGGYTGNPPPMDKVLSKASGLRREDNYQLTTTYKETFVQGIPNLAYVGYFRGPSMAIMELQARYVAGVFSGQLQRPCDEKIKAGVKEATALRNLNPKPGFPHGNYVGFALELAQEIGAVPQKYNIPGEPMIPGHFRENGIGAKPEIAKAQHQRLTNRLNNA